MIFKCLSLVGSGAEGVRGRKWSGGMRITDHIPSSPSRSPQVSSEWYKWTQHGGTSSPHCSFSKLWDFLVPQTQKTTQLTAWRASRSWTVWITKQESHILECRRFSEKREFPQQTAVMRWKLQLKLRHSGLNNTVRHLPLPLFLINLLSKTWTKFSTWYE